MFEKFDTGDSVQDMNLAEHFEQNRGREDGHIIRCADCVIYVEGELTND